MKTCNYFTIKELVSEITYKERGERAWTAIDPNLMVFIDFLRDMFGRTWINDWSWGGNNHWRGLRTVESRWFSQYSQHTFGRACDMTFTDYSAQEIRDWLRDNVEVWQEATGVKSITVEEEVTWLHIDFRNNEDGYNSFAP